MREIDGAKWDERIPLAQPQSGCLIFPRTVHGEYCRFLEWRRGKGGCRMRDVMGNEEDFPLKAEFFSKNALHLHFHTKPFGYSAEKGLQGKGIRLYKTVENPLELQQRLLVVGQGLNVIEGNASFAKTERHRLKRKRVIVLDARESFFLGGDEHLAVLEQGRRTIVVKRRNSENIHLSTAIRRNLFARNLHSKPSARKNLRCGAL